MTGVESLRAILPEAARDISLNLESVLSQSSLAPPALWGVAVAAGFATRHRGLAEALVGDAERAGIDAAVLDDALAAAALMGMSNVVFRFRHLVGKSYTEKPARLRMNRKLRPKSCHAYFELFSLAVSAINGCEACVLEHEKCVIDSGMSEDNVHDAVRIAATIAATAVSLEAAGVLAQVRGSVPLCEA
jgi:alkyl hydroperoxide reductase subunit D